MAPSMFLFLILVISSSTIAMSAFNIVNFGAKPDGTTDTSGALLSAWAMACSLNTPASISIPAGTFYVSKVLFRGPCNNTNIRIFSNGTLVAPYEYTANDRWIAFKYVNGVSVYGGVFDGRGQRLWNCKLAGGSCPVGSSSIMISRSTNVHISGITSMNSELFHLVLYGTSKITITNMKIKAPENSPNTDGIHTEMSDQVTITASSIGTGDDCISIGQGTTNLRIKSINCGPGHGISIGSLGQTKAASVQNITVKSTKFTSTQNGLRIKTWAIANPGLVQGVNFQNAIMRNVQNPILVDQNYCPGNVNCPRQTSGIKISGVTYSDIRGTSATPIAMKFDCSLSNPCRGFLLQKINLTYMGYSARSYCRNVKGRTSGAMIVPPSCF